MINRKLHVAMFAVTGLSLPAVAQADVRDPQVTKILASSPTDFAPITDANNGAARLRRTDEEQPGNEMAHVAFFADGIHGLYFDMNTDIVDPSCTAGTACSNRANDRIQLAMIPFHLAQDPTTKAVSAVPDFGTIGQVGGARFVTNNQGNEYRNANHPIAYSIAGGTAICAEYNYQRNNGNNTERYLECFNQSGATILPQTRIYAKNNDDCSMNQDKNSTWVAQTSGNVTRLVAWRGCNGNGQDDGWAQTFTLTVDNATNPTSATFKQLADVSLCPREERSHGYCTTGTDPSFAVCSWTEGNTQPQRDGVWLAAIDITGQTTGQQSILWKQQIDGRKQLPDGNHTYAMRAMHDRIKLPDASGVLQNTDLIVWRSADVRGNNNGNNKGGTYFGNNLAVLKVTKTGVTPVIPLQDISINNPQSQVKLAVDGTHLGMVYGVFGTVDHPVPGVAFVAGSHTGGGYSANMAIVGLDTVNTALTNLGSKAVAPYDRHLYSNYLGNNPGNQGRNYLGTELIENPFAKDSTGAPIPGADRYLMVISSTAKPADEIPSTTCPTCAQKKLAAYLTVVPVAQNPMGAGTGGGSGSGMGSGSGTGGGTGGGTGMGSGSGSGSSGSATDPTTDPQSDPGTTLGGCNAAGGTGGAVTFLLIGLAAFIRRRK